ncbi:sirohydrochlorin chelatase [Ramlibacter tataouinensis]|uniref:Cobalamin biosynthesis protein CbiX n=1 Tax=Ramlibacter tataouinensis (strain ATCC BAA-407 / DSM 14655 / LMG 21543 / TTB310) TaxID=365046 RepID=F5XX87_RAMTT|nr:CbiX/SirB N-terminal domain-containing protein [Ramlibacter tataouinensis]AEG93031.1 conserved hypothetical protein [Ramlibacter tataouinensis TTB310]
MSDTASHAVILFAHGSRDPLWRLPMEAVAARLARRAPGLLVRCAYLELTQPDLPTAAADLARAGATQVAITPMFLGAGRHVREDLPALVEQLKAAHPGVIWTLRPPVGEDERLLDLLAEIAAEQSLE